MMFDILKLALLCSVVIGGVFGRRALLLGIVVAVGLMLLLNIHAAGVPR